MWGAIEVGMNNAAAAKLQTLSALRDQLVGELRAAKTAEERREARECLCDCLRNMRVLTH